LTTINGSPFSAPFLADFGLGVGESNMTLNPAGTLLFISDTTKSGIYVFSIGSGGVLTLVAGSPFAVPFEPMNLATDGLGKYLYAINGDFTTHTGSEIAAYTIGTGGALAPVVGSPFSGAGYAMWLLKGEPTGKYLIGTSGKSAFYSGSDDNHLYVFSITQSGASAGAITAAGSVVTQFSPFSIAAQSNGNLIYSFSFNDTATGFNGVEGYEISSSGTLSAVQGSPFTGVAEGSWGQFDQSGAFLFSYSSFLNLSTNTVVTQLGPIDVGSGGLLTQPVSTLTLANPGFWVVTDPQ
jgi:DNA-binding beta-propeller fold protein YncE